MRARGLFVPFGLLVSSVAVACSSAEGDPRLTPEVEQDAAPPSPRADAPDAEVDLADAGRPAIEPASRLEVACAQKPCYVAVSGSGSKHVCGLLEDGTVRCWGRDTLVPAGASPDASVLESDGALGRGHAVTKLEGATPAPVAGLGDVKQISVGRNLGTCALTSDGSVYCWGRNEFGQLGQPSSQAQLPIPTRIEGLPPMSKIALGGTTGCAIATGDGALHCWGTHVTRIDRTPGPTFSFPPQRMTAFTAPIREIAIGTTSPLVTGWGAVPFQDTIVALRDDGVLESLGELPAGESSNDELHLPLPIEQPGVIRVGAFAYLAADGILSRWVPARRALYVPGASTTVDVAIAIGRSEGVGSVEPFNYVEQAGVLLANGHLYRWGLNTAGALGYSPDDLDVATEPMDMTHVAGDRVVSFATTNASTCVSLVDGTVKCWGTNQYGELGRGAVDDERHPEAEVIR